MCLFCKIVNKEIPSKTIYEDEFVIGILDILQATRGHTLIIPKVHTKNMLECPVSVLNHVNNAVSIVGNHLVKTLNAEGLNILSNVGEISGQTIMHFHVHLIPRYKDDHGFSLHLNPSGLEATDELTDLLKI